MNDESGNKFFGNWKVGLFGVSFGEEHDSFILLKFLEPVVIIKFT